MTPGIPGFREGKGVMPFFRRFAWVSLLVIWSSAAATPAAETGELNYFIYPHVEVNGKVYPREKIDLSFSFNDTASSDE